VTTFYLIRHGEHALLGRVLAGRMPGVPLSERGRAEAGWLAERLAEERIDALYASPIARTRETAAIIAERLRLPVICREDVIELDYGEWTGASFETVRGDPRWQLWSRCRSIATLPGGESMRAVQQRIVAALFDLYVRHPNGRVAIVSHGDVIRAALLFALGMPLDFYARIEVAPASISTLRLEASGIRVLGLNERPRLGADNPAPGGEAAGGGDAGDNRRH
jgi:broad specificity phosphatase PhoE